MADPSRTVHDVGFRDDRCWHTDRIFGGTRMIHRRLDRYAAAEIGPGDTVILAERGREPTCRARRR